MEPYNQNQNSPTPSPFKDRHRSGRVMGGLVIVIVGSLILANKAGLDVPYWILTWPSILIAVGVYLGFRHSFKGFGWAVPIIIGVVFHMREFYPELHLMRYFWPVAIICFGLYMILKPSRKGNDKYWKDWDATNITETSGDDYIDSTVIFGGVKKNIISKNFRGGEAVTVFGGTEINLTQADVPTPIVLDLTQVFGGTKLIVPPHWKIQSQDVVCILGGVEDKRPIMADPSAVDSNKVLILKGTCILGGIDIKSF
jgi:predicted membrane protein